MQVCFCCFCGVFFFFIFVFVCFATGIAPRNIKKIMAHVKCGWPDGIDKADSAGGNWLKEGVMLEQMN